MEKKYPYDRITWIAGSRAYNHIPKLKCVGGVQINTFRLFNSPIL